MTKEDIDRIASEYFNDKESEHEMDEVFDLAKRALEKQMQEPIMAGEEDKERTFDVLQFVADNAGLSIFEAIEKAYNIGVSDQEPILDKIREEIMSLTDGDTPERIWNVDVLEIIDKYKTK